MLGGVAQQPALRCPCCDVLLPPGACGRGTETVTGLETRLRRAGSAQCIVSPRAVHWTLACGTEQGKNNLQQDLIIFYFIKILFFISEKFNWQGNHAINRCKQRGTFRSLGTRTALRLQGSEAPERCRA